MATENEILEYFGRKYCGNIGKGKTKQDIPDKDYYERQEAAKHENPEFFIEYAKKQISLGNIPKLDHLEQLADLPPIKELQGERAEVHLHEYWNKIEPLVIQQHIKKSDTMVIASCVDKKPYTTNKSYQFLLERTKGKFGDLFVNAVYLWPIECDHWLAARVYNVIECIPGDQEYNTLSAKVKFERTVRYLETFKYKKVIIWNKPDEMYSLYNQWLSEYCKSNDIEFCEVMDEEMVSQLLPVFDNRPSLLNQKIFQPLVAKRKFDLFIGYPYPTVVPSEEARKEKAIKDKEHREEAKQRAKDKKALQKIGFNFK